MPKPAKGPRLGSGPSHERLMLSGLAAALIRDERIRTTEAKAKRLRSVADRLITLGKRGTVHARRQALSVVEDRDVVHKLFSDIAPRYSARVGGYTRILKLGPRKGDAAPMALIELVEEAESAKTAAAAPEGTAGRRGVLRRRGRRTKAEEAAAPAEEPAEEAPLADEEIPGAEAEAPAAEVAEVPAEETAAQAPAEETAAQAPAEEGPAEAAPQSEAETETAPGAEGEKPES